MAIIYKASLVPTKLAALAAWVPGRPWGAGVDGTALTQVGAFRFDDPDGAVGIETLLLRTADGRLLQVPLTYRSAPLAGAEGALVTTMEHSVLGPRWAYDGCADPVAVRALVAAVVTGGSGAPLDFDPGSGVLERRAPTMTVAGSGAPGAAVPAVDAVRARDTDRATVVDAGAVEVTVHRVLDPGLTDGDAVLRGTWPDQPTPAVLAAVRPCP